MGRYFLSGKATLLYFWPSVSAAPLVQPPQSNVRFLGSCLLRFFLAMRLSSSSYPQKRIPQPVVLAEFFAMKHLYKTFSMPRKFCTRAQIALKYAKNAIVRKSA